MLHLSSGTLWGVFTFFPLGHFVGFCQHLNGWIPYPKYIYPTCWISSTPEHTQYFQVSSQYWLLNFWNLSVWSHWNFLPYFCVDNVTSISQSIQSLHFPGLSSKGHKIMFTEVVLFRSRIGFLSVYFVLFDFYFSSSLAY